MLRSMCNFSPEAQFASISTVDKSQDLSEQAQLMNPSQAAGWQAYKLCALSQLVSKIGIKYTFCLSLLLSP